MNAESGSEFNSKIHDFPFYNPGMGNESGFNYRTVEIKSHSFSVRHPKHLAGENIIFEPGEFRPDNE